MKMFREVVDKSSKRGKREHSKTGLVANGGELVIVC